MVASPGSSHVRVTEDTAGVARRFVGGEGGPLDIVTRTESAVSTAPSLTVSVRVMVVLESIWGAVNEGERVAASASVMLRAGWSCDHR